MWEAAYKENKKNQKSLFNRLKEIAVPQLKSVKIAAIKDEWLNKFYQYQVGTDALQQWAPGRINYAYEVSWSLF